jgi:hypothetical protein
MVVRSRISDHSTKPYSRRPCVAQDSLDAGQALIDSSMVHINLKTVMKIDDDSAQRAGESR